MIEGVARADTPREMSERRRVPGEEGLWVFILGDMTVFALLFGAFLYTRHSEPDVFAAGRQELTAAFAFANTLLLLTSSLLVALASQAHRAGRMRSAARLIAGAGGCALTFVVLKVFEWSDVIFANPDLAQNQFFVYYFAITGLHLFHLLLGTVGLVVIWRTMRRSVPGKHDRLIVEAGCSYWHMVDLLWVVIFPLLYFSAT